MSGDNDELRFLAEWIAETIRDSQPGVAGPLADGWDQYDDGLQVKEDGNEIHIHVNKGTHPDIREYTIIVRRE